MNARMRLAGALLAASVFVIGVAGQASAQTDREPVITIDNESPAAGDDVTIDISNAEPDATVEVMLADQVAVGSTDADGAASIRVSLPGDAKGNLDGIVNIGGKEVPFKLVVQAAQADAGEGGSGTTATPLPETGPDDAGTIAVLALAALLAGGTLILLARRTHATR